MIELKFTQEQAKDLAVIMDAALKAAGLQLVRQVNYWAGMLDQAIDQSNKVIVSGPEELKEPQK